MSAEQIAGAAPGQPRLRRWLWACGALLLGVWLVAVVMLVSSALQDSRLGRASLAEFNAGSATQSGSATNLTGLLDAVDAPASASRRKQSADLTGAAKSFEAAADTLGSAVLAPLNLLPVVGRQLRASRNLAISAAATTRSTDDAISSLSVILDEETASPNERVPTTQQIQQVLLTLQTELQAAALKPSPALIGPVNRSQKEFLSEYNNLLGAVDSAVLGTTGVLEFLQGPNKYLVLAANNAEMRAGSGMYLQTGTLEVQDGSFSLGEFLSSTSLKLEQPGATLDPKLEALWSPLQPTQEWRNLNVTPRFDESARMASEMWTAAASGNAAAESTHNEAPVQGVMAIDVIGLKRLLELVGPVQIEGAEGPIVISAENVKSELLLQQYLRGDLDSGDGQQERRSQLGLVAAAVFESFNSQPVPASELMRALQSAGSGRHLLMWSNQPTQQEGWEALGLSGKVADHDLMVSILNRGGNKLDQFLTTSSTLSAERDKEIRRVTVDVRLTNAAPRGLPRYVAGPYPETALAAGDYLGLLAVTAPLGSGNPQVTGAELVGTAQDGLSKVFVSRVLIPPGETLTVSVGFDLPVGWDTINVLPSARIPPMAWTAGSETWNDNRMHRVDLASLN